MTARSRTFAIIGLGLIAALAIYGWRYRSTEPEPATDRAKVETRTPSSSLVPSSPDERTHIVHAPGTRVMSAAERQTLVTALAMARARRSVPPAPSAGSANAADPAVVSIADKTGDSSPWEKRTLAALNAMVDECFSRARATQPDLEGTLTVRFSIAGEPQVGGLVDDIAFDDKGSTITQGDMRDCVRESMSALELDPPPSGLKVGRQLSLKLP